MMPRGRKRRGSCQTIIRWLLRLLNGRLPSSFTGHHVEMAKQHGALLVALEHRFYGYSVNPDGLELENLASLTSQQA